MANFFSWIVNKLRYARFAMSSRMKILSFGAIYYGNYSNWKHDPTPLIWIQYSDRKYTHAINIHYLNYGDKAWLMNTIYMLKRGAQRIDGLTFYRLLKMRRPSIVKTAYRVYFTNLLNVKLVSAGITPLDKMIYTTSNDPWVAQLNEMIKPSELREGVVQVAYSPTELQDRITSAQNATDIRQTRVAPPVPRGPVGQPAPYIRR
jgi:hypothetical protein